jgi:hypothetical protein
VVDVVTRVRFVLGILVGACGACGIASHAHAQRPYEIGEGLADSARVAWGAVQGCCLTVLQTGFVIPAADSTCRVVNVVPLGTVGGVEWHVARYRRHVFFADSALADTMDLDEMALFSRAPGAADGHLAWHVVRDRDVEFLDSLLLTRTQRDTFLELTICLNGTGGCGTEYLRFLGNRWHALSQPFAKALQARLPAGHWLHKGRQLDLASLTGVWPVAAPGDGNCCPSLEIPFAVRLAGDSLTLLSAGPLRPSPDR